MRSPCMKRLGCPGRLGRKSTVPAPSVSTVSMSLPSGTHVQMDDLTAQYPRLRHKFAGLRQRLRFRHRLLHGQGMGEGALACGGVELEIDDLAGDGSAHGLGGRNQLSVMLAFLISRIAMASPKVSSKESAANSTLRPGSSWTPCAVTDRASLSHAPCPCVITDDMPSMCSVSPGQASTTASGKLSIPSRGSKLPQPQSTWVWSSSPLFPSSEAPPRCAGVTRAKSDRSRHPPPNRVLPCSELEIRAPVSRGLSGVTREANAGRADLYDSAPRILFLTAVVAEFGNYGGLCQPPAWPW